MKEEEIPLKLYNTETRSKEPVTPLDGKKIRMYTCGPTVYNFAHIGNFRAYVFEDLLRRTVQFFGFPVEQVMNITDIDDKIIKGAIQTNRSLEDFTKPYIEAFFEDLRTLKIQPAEHYPRATQYVQQMIQIIQTLVDKGTAYQSSDGSIYFSIDHFPSYGRLSHLHLEDLKAGASERLAADEYDKDNVADFALWKSYNPEHDRDIFWDSPFGRGRPGWHIECSAMSMALLGESIDIHAGGVDNIFPHHENEIAQSEACTGKHFVNLWVHCEHLLVNHKKMSKSLGNFYTLRDLLQKGYKGEQIRYVLLQTHYRMPLNFTFEGLDAAASSLDRLGDFISRLRTIDSDEEFGLAKDLIKIAHRDFKTALGDDLNISQALAVLFDFVRQINTLCDSKKIGQREAQEALKFLEQLDRVLGVLPFKAEQVSLSHQLEEALEKRQQARAEKNWKEADKWRDFILSHGYLIEDTPTGARIKKGKG